MIVSPIPRTELVIFILLMLIYHAVNTTEKRSIQVHRAEKIPTHPKSRNMGMKVPVCREKQQRREYISEP
jgi:hypothetical protein